MADTITVDEPADKDAYVKMASYPLIKHCDMESEMRNEAVEICTGAVEKYGAKDLERASQLIKESMDKKFGAPWNAVVKHLLYLFFGGQFAVLLWKAQ